MPTERAEKKTTIKFHSWFGGVKCECGKFIWGNFRKTEFSCPKCGKSYGLIFICDDGKPVDVEEA